MLVSEEKGYCDCWGFYMFVNHFVSFTLFLLVSFVDNNKQAGSAFLGKRDCVLCIIGIVGAYDENYFLTIDLV